MIFDLDINQVQPYFSLYAHLVANAYWLFHDHSECPGWLWVSARTLYWYLGSQADWFKSYKSYPIVNPEDRFSRKGARLSQVRWKLFLFIVPLTTINIWYCCNNNVYNTHQLSLTRPIPQWLRALSASESPPLRWLVHLHTSRACQRVGLRSCTLLLIAPLWEVWIVWSLEYVVVLSPVSLLFWNEKDLSKIFFPVGQNPCLYFLRQETLSFSFPKFILV